MAKLKLADIDMGLGNVPRGDPLHDAQTLLNRSLGTDSDDYRAIPLSQIILNPQNDYSGEDTDEDIRELANDIERNGLLHNIVVSDHTKSSTDTAGIAGVYMILSGERRYKAVRLLYEERKENKYALILCKVLAGLDELDEMLVLDAANLQTRGGMQDERRFRKATLRFIENLRKKGGVSERDAIGLATRYTGVSDKLIDRNLTVEKNLHPEILSLLDRDLIPKNQAVQYARLPAEMQAMLAQNLSAAYAMGGAALKDANDKLFLATKTIADLTSRLEAKEKSMREVDEEIANAQLSLTALNAMAEDAARAGEMTEELRDQIDLVKKTLAELETQKRMYANTIASAKATLKKSEDRLADVGRTQTHLTDGADDGSGFRTGGVPGDNALRNDIAAMVNKAMKKAESGVQSVTSRTSVNRMRKLDLQGKRVMLERIHDMRVLLDDAVTMLEDAIEQDSKKQGTGER